MGSKVLAALIGALGTAVGVLGAAVLKYLAGSEDVAQQIATELRDDLAEDRDHWRDRAYELLDEREDLLRRVGRLESQVEAMRTYLREHPDVDEDPSEIIDH